MKIYHELVRVTKILSRYPGQWAICGGVAASLYRLNARFTDDIDIALIDSKQIPALGLAVQVIHDLGLKEYRGFIPKRVPDNEQVLGLICARGTDSDRFIGIDFLLPVQFWVQSAVELAQENLIDYGFGKLPTITPENLIVAKIAALESNPDRYQDLDDIKNILESNKLNTEYIKRQVSTYQLRIGDELRKIMGRALHKG